MKEITNDQITGIEGYALENSKEAWAEPSNQNKNLLTGSVHEFVNVKGKLYQVHASVSTNKSAIELKNIYQDYLKMNPDCIVVPNYSSERFTTPTAVILKPADEKLYQQIKEEKKLAQTYKPILEAILEVRANIKPAAPDSHQPKSR